MTNLKLQTELYKNSLILKDFFKTVEHKAYEQNPTDGFNNLKDILYDRFLLYVNELYDRKIKNILYEKLHQSEFIILDAAFENDSKLENLTNQHYLTVFKTIEEVLKHIQYGNFFKIFLMSLPAFKDCFSPEEHKNIFVLCAIESLNNETDIDLIKVRKAFENYFAS